MNDTPESKSLIRIRNLDLGFWKRIRHVTCEPEVYFAPTIKSVLDERDLVPKTGRRFFNPGRFYTGGIHILLPSAYFRWQEPVTNGEEYREFVGMALKKCQERGMDLLEYLTAIEEDRKISERDIQLTEEILIPALEMGRLYDGVTEMPIRISLDTCPSNGQKLWYIEMAYGPYPRKDIETRITTLMGYSDHSNISTADPAAKPSLADVLRGMVPRLEPAV